MNVGEYCVECEHIRPDGAVNGEVLRRTWRNPSQAVAEALRWAALLYQSGRPFRVAVTKLEGLDPSGHGVRSPTDFHIEYRADEIQVAAELPAYGLDWLN